MGGLTIPHKMWVTEITDECIMGLDFLGKHGCQVDLKENVLTIGSEEVPLSKPARGAGLTCCRIIAKEAVVVAPHSEALVPGQSAGSSDIQARWGITERPQLGGLLVGRSLIDLTHPILPVRVLNPCSESFKVKKGDELAICEPVLSVHVPEQRDQYCKPTVLPKHVAELYARCTGELQASQKEEVHKLLMGYADVFSWHIHSTPSSRKPNKGLQP